MRNALYFKRKYIDTQISSDNSTEYIVLWITQLKSSWSLPLRQTEKPKRSRDAVYMQRYLLVEFWAKYHIHTHISLCFFVRANIGNYLRIRGEIFLLYSVKLLLYNGINSKITFSGKLNFFADLLCKRIFNTSGRPLVLNNPSFSVTKFSVSGTLRFSYSGAC